MNWHSGFVSYISKSWKSTKSKMLKLENFQNEEMFGGHKHKVNYSNFWFSLFPWRRTTFLNNYLEQFWSEWTWCVDTLQIRLRWNPNIHMDIFVFSLLSFLSKLNPWQRYASGSFCDVPVRFKKGEVIKF